MNHTTTIRPMRAAAGQVVFVRGSGNQSFVGLSFCVQGDPSPTDPVEGQGLPS